MALDPPQCHTDLPRTPAISQQLEDADNRASYGMTTEPLSSTFCNPVQFCPYLHYTSFLNTGK